MNVKSIEWRFVQTSPKWHLFIGRKAVCNRAYSDSKYESSETPPEQLICGHCKNAIPRIIKRLEDIIK